MGPLLAWCVAAALGTGTLALYRAEAMRPDPTGQRPQNRLVLMLASASAWISLGFLALLGLYRFGLVRPVLIAAILLAIYRLALSRDLSPYYKFSAPLGIAALIGTIAVLAGTSTLRITP